MSVMIVTLEAVCIEIFYRNCKCEPRCRRQTCERGNTKRELVPDPISCAPWSMLFGDGKRCDLCSQDTQLHVPFSCCLFYALRDQCQFPP